MCRIIIYITRIHTVFRLWTTNITQCDVLSICSICNSLINRVRTCIMRLFKFRKSNTTTTRRRGRLYLFSNGTGETANGKKVIDFIDGSRGDALVKWLRKTNGIRPLFKLDFYVVEKWLQTRHAVLRKIIVGNRVAAISEANESEPQDLIVKRLQGSRRSRGYANILGETRRDNTNIWIFTIYKHNK